MHWNQPTRAGPAADQVGVEEREREREESERERECPVNLCCTQSFGQFAVKYSQPGAKQGTPTSKPKPSSPTKFGDDKAWSSSTEWGSAQTNRTRWGLHRTNRHGLGGCSCASEPSRLLPTHSLSHSNRPPGQWRSASAQGFRGNPWPQTPCKQASKRVCG